MKENSLGTQFRTLAKHISDFQYLSLLYIVMVHRTTRIQSQVVDGAFRICHKGKISSFNHFRNWHKPLSES